MTGMEYIIVLLPAVPLLVIAFGLLGCLFLRKRRWVYQKERLWEGRGINTRRLEKRVYHLRQDHASSLVPHSSARRQTLLASARRMILHCAYFQLRDRGTSQEESRPPSA